MEIKPFSQTSVAPSVERRAVRFHRFPSNVLLLLQPLPLRVGTEEACCTGSDLGPDSSDSGAGTERPGGQERVVIVSFDEEEYIAS